MVTEGCNEMHECRRGAVISRLHNVCGRKTLHTEEDNDDGVLLTSSHGYLLVRLMLWDKLIDDVDGFDDWVQRQSSFGENQKSETGREQSQITK